MIIPLPPAIQIPLPSAPLVDLAAIGTCTSAAEGMGNRQELRHSFDHFKNKKSYPTLSTKVLWRYRLWPLVRLNPGNRLQHKRASILVLIHSNGLPERVSRSHDKSAGDFH